MDTEKTNSHDGEALRNSVGPDATGPHGINLSPQNSHDASPKPIVETDHRDEDEQPKLEKEDGSKEASPTASSNTSISKTIVSFGEGDLDNPHNWTQWRKSYTVIVAIFTVINSTIGSSIAAGATEPLSAYFHVSDQAQLVLPTSIFLVGYTVGPLVWGPLSESYGRRGVMFYAFFGFTIFTLACALAPTWVGLIIFRLLAGVFASCPIAVVGGICADVYDDPTTRGRAMSIFMAATTWGPIIGPAISGFVSVITWRWAFWVGLIIAGATWLPLAFMPETYAPIILKKRAKKARKQLGDPNVFAPIELEERNIRHTITVVLTRPVRMFFFEPIVLFSCLYLSLAYAIFYIFFQSFPIIYGGIYGFNAGEQGLAFLPIGVGAIIACCIYLLWDSILTRAHNRDAPWSRSEESRRLPLACLAGPFIVVSLFWAGWTAKEGIHWIVPVLSGITFGVGFLLIFMALLNYIVDAYEIFAASAMAAASTSRSVFGAVLPFAARPMYRSLGVPWACSLLGFLSLAMCVIPFVFIKYGDKIRANSKFCQYLLQKKREEEEKRQREASEGSPERQV
ncbi:hypothetical protein W97_01452 [Coniosporium apollinis CBS 100218]|uniref:Major facilitator superfamily (MFS) profile domain-containing protein n=1 Tax=Coniosporium apollinis (strain CBS 100218) TaxID=1168221 RepID=R7YKS8_CONA1|nr:uncharacterized protein W97_01452 [Coniosporium apollinis CBS 100218]EON62231.1 hypothetical protein W97_01452 [Coniosporium apollinis CBS 100218]